MTTNTVQKRSRYRNTKPFALPVGERAAFEGFRARELITAEGMLEHVVKEGDRLDLLALHYYNDTRLWWRIIDANPEIVFAGKINMNEITGEIILIPRSDDSGVSM